MSNVIDQRIVEMRFDNKHFESNVSTTMSTLDKLKQSLNLKGASKGLEDVGKAAKNCDVSVVGDSAEKVGLKFNAMYTIADQALRNITNSAMVAGKRIVSALTIDPVKTGFSEYETQINAIQTILANTESKGTTLDDVNGALDELNTYADKTIYNFTEMTRNIGTFTAAGVDLDTSVSAIKGIANLAAVSGSTSQQASVAMYQLSQAMASGTVKLMDWNSVVNAGMGGQVFQNALKETAKVHGVAIDDIISKQGSFRESLSEGWLTTEILTDTLAKFTGDLSEEQLKSMGYTEKQVEEIMKLGKTANDAATKVKTFSQLFDTLKEAAQSGWTQTWEIIVGDFEEAKALLTAISDTIGGVIGRSAEARNELLENWKVLGGRDDLIESFKNIWDSLLSIIAPIKEAFREIFPAMTAERLVSMTSALKNFTAKLKLSDKSAENLKRTFKGVFAVFSITKEIIFAVFETVASLFGGLGDLSGGILDITATMGDWLVTLDEIIRTGDIFGTIFKGVGKVLQFSVKIVAAVVKGVASLLRGLSLVGGASEGMSNSVTSAFNNLGESLENNRFFQLFEDMWNVLKAMGSGIAKVFKSVAGAISNTFKTGGLSGILELIKTLSVGSIAIFVAKFVKGFSNIVKSVNGFTDGIVGILDSVRGCFEAYQTQLKAGALLKIASAIAILTASLVVLSMIDSEKLGNAIGALTVLFAELMAGMAIFTKIAGGSKGLLDTAKSLISLSMASKAMISMSAAIFILAIALRAISSLDSNQLHIGIAGIASLAAVLVVTAKILGAGGKAAIKGATKMILFATAIKILASACISLSSLSWTELAKGLVGVGVLLVAVAGFMNIAKFNKRSITTATGVVLIASSIKILASACQDFAGMKWGGITKGLVSIGLLLAAVAGFTNLAGNAKHVISTGLALIAMAAAMKIFASAVKDMASMSWGDLAKGLVGIASALAAVTIAMKFMPKNMIDKGLGLIGVATSLLIIREAVEGMGSMSWGTIAKGIVAIGGSLLILAGGLRLMKGTLGGSAALLIAAVALLILAPALAILGGVGWKTIEIGLFAIAGAFAVLGVAALLLKPVIGTMVTLSYSLLLIGVGVLAAGIGLTAFGAGLSALAVGITAVVASIGAVIGELGDTISALIVVILKALGKAIVVICEVLRESIPVIVDTILEIVIEVFASLVEYLPQIIDLVVKFIIAIIDGIAANMPELIKSLVNLFASIFHGLGEALSDVDPSSLLKAVAVVAILALLVNKLAAINASTIPKAMLGLAGVGILLAELSLILVAIGGMAQIPGFTWLVNEGGNLLEAMGIALLKAIPAFGAVALLLVAAAALKPLLGPAMVGIAGLGVVIAEIAVILAALGALAQIPGLTWLINEGGNLLEAVGIAIGKFVGGIVGGIAAGVTGILPQIGSDLGAFMTNVQPFIEGAKNIDASLLVGVGSLVGAILAITAASVLEGITSFLTGGSSIAEFAAELPVLGEGLKSFSDSVVGIDNEAVTAAANAAKALADMCSAIPNEGGVASWFAGENSISKFAGELPILGAGLKGFSDAVAGVNPEVITAAANAAKTLADMCSAIPNEGGVASWFAGENSISKFSEEIVLLGSGLKGFSDAVAGVNPETVTAAANAAKTLADMTNAIPNEGGVVSWFAGENSISKFAEEIPLLGTGLKGFSDATSGVNPETVTAAANAAKTLADMTSAIPNEGGVVSWFAGENSISKFSEELPLLGTGLKGFSDAVAGVNPETVTAAANAAKTLAEMTENIPNEGGVVSWFAGENSITKFSDELPLLGKGLKGFSDATLGVNPETMLAAANAGESLAKLTESAPVEGGVKAWFSGESSISKFADELPKMGKGLKGFSDAVAGVNPDTITAAASAASGLADLTKNVPKEGGIKAWFSGESSISKFADKLPDLGKGLKDFSTSVAGVNPENITAAANAAKSLAQMTESVPKKTDKIEDFGDNLAKFGNKLSTYFSKISGINSSSVTASSNAIASVKDLLTIDTGKIKTVSSTLDGVTNSIKKLADAPKNSLSNITKSLKDLGKSSVEAFAKEFDKLDDKLEDAAKDAISAFSKSVDKKKSDASGSFTKVAEACAKALTDKKKSFESAGKSLAQGFADGISANSYIATAKAKAMAEAAAAAVKAALAINSPSKVLIDIGSGVPEGFAVGIGKLGNVVEGSVESMTDSSIDGVRNGISRIADIVNGDIDAQPTIRPVLDLDGVRKGASAINGILGSRSSLSMMSNIGAISSIMDRKNQNGANDDVVSAINKLNKNLENVGGTYSFGNISYNDDSAISEAVQALVRAAIIQGRV